MPGQTKRGRPQHREAVRKVSNSNRKVEADLTRKAMKLCHAGTVALLVLVTGCATPSSGVIPLSEGIAKVTHQGAGPWVGTAELKARAIQEATTYCERSRTRIRVIDVKEIQARPLGGWPEAEVFFMCD